MAEQRKVHGYSKDDLMNFKPDDLRAVLHERVHHTIEVYIYRILKGELDVPEDFGEVGEYLLGLWEERSLPMTPPDIQWCRRYVGLAKRLRNGEKLEIREAMPAPFTDEEIRTVDKLIFGRKSIRQFKPEPVPDEYIRKILLAGLYAPHGCNVCCTRFLVLKDPQEQKLLRSDIPIENCIMIVVLQEMSMYKTLRFDKFVPQNIYYDAAAAADHICLMAHALGLGACWLTHGEETQKTLREYFGLSETITSRNHIVIGWPDEATIKSERMDLDEVILNKE
jgi:nitroreductase